MNNMRYPTSISTEEAAAFDEVASKTNRFAYDYGEAKSSMVKMLQVSGLQHGSPSPLGISGRADNSSAAWLEVQTMHGFTGPLTTRYPFKIPLDPDSKEAAAIASVTDSKGFPAHKVFIRKLGSYVDIRTKGTTRQPFDYSSVDKAEKTASGKTINIGDGKIQLPDGRILVMRERVADGLESQLLEGTLALIATSIDDWARDAGLRIREWSPEVMSIIERVDQRAKAQLAKDPDT